MSSGVPSLEPFANRVELINLLLVGSQFPDIEEVLVKLPSFVHVNRSLGLDVLLVLQDVVLGIS